MTSSALGGTYAALWRLQTGERPRGTVSAAQAPVAPVTPGV